MYYWFMEKLTKIAATIQVAEGGSGDENGKAFDGATSRRLRELVKKRLQDAHKEKAKYLRLHATEKDKKLKDAGIREPYPKVEW